MNIGLTLGLIDILLLLLALGLCIFGLYIAGFSQFRLYRNVRQNHLGRTPFRRRLFFLVPLAVIFFSDELDPQGMQDRTRFSRGFGFMTIGAVCLLISYAVGIGWH
jgi:hypothetical protein